MNIVTQFPVNLNLNFANPQTETARKEAAARELIAQTEQLEQYKHEKGLGHDTETTKQQPLTYDYIRAQQKERPEQQQAEEAKEKQQADSQDDATAEHENRGKQDDKDASSQAATEEKKVEELKDRDQEVRRHEQAHANVGGQYAGSPSYDFERGPDGNNYAVGGEVKIDVSKVTNDPEATAAKMQQVQRAALAPEEPSPQDRKVAAEAGQKLQEARAEILEQASETPNTKPDLASQISSPSNNQASGQTEKLDQASQPQNVASVIKAEEIAAQGIKVSTVPVFEAKQSLSMPSEDSQPSYQETLAQSDQRINSRALKIQRHYNISSQPQQPSQVSHFA